MWSAPPCPFLLSSFRWSGVTSDIMQAVTKTLEEARGEIMAIISASDVLIGHSLENDLHALRLVHCNVVDTAVLYGEVRKPSLRHITKQFLHRTIQTGEHNSAEDALAALDLAYLKFCLGPSYGKRVGIHQSLMEVFLDALFCCHLFYS